jgi:hypothetical protein
MRTATLACAALIGGTLAFAQACSAQAKPVPIGGNTPEHVKAMCQGTFVPPGKGKDATWGCLGSDDHGLICGGPGQYRSTCEAFEVRGRTTLPTREELQQERDQRNPPTP